MHRGKNDLFRVLLQGEVQTFGSFLGLFGSIQGLSSLGWYLMTKTLQGPLGSSIMSDDKGPEALFDSLVFLRGIVHRRSARHGRLEHSDERAPRIGTPTMVSLSTI